MPKLLTVRRHKQKEKEQGKMIIIKPRPFQHPDVREWRGEEWIILPKTLTKLSKRSDRLGVRMTWLD